jgi:hypothetical protein
VNAHTPRHHGKGCECVPCVIAGLREVNADLLAALRETTHLLTALIQRDAYIPESRQGIVDRALAAITKATVTE